MKAFVYILFSKKLNRFYVGSTELRLEQRLELHLEKNYGSSKFTAKVNDWIIYESYFYESVTTARKVERYIKAMKSRKFIESLKNNPDKWKWISERLSLQ